MDRNALIVIAAAAVGHMLGCHSVPSPVAGDDFRIIEGPSFSIAKSGAERITTPPSPALLTAQAASINRFAVDLYRLLGVSPGNLFFSPYSITAALGMTEAGARGETSAQMRRALSITLAGDDFHAAINGLDLSLTGHTEATDGVTLNAVNTTWAQTGWDMRVQYLSVLARHYGAGVNLLDFASAPDPSRIVINTWVADQTNQKIQDLIAPGMITPSTVFVLTNAIYFLGDWLYQFDVAATTDEAFTLLDGSTVSVPLMSLRGEAGPGVKLRYARVGSLRAIDLPYRGNRLCMTVVLPDPGAFDSVERSLSAGLIDTIVGSLRETDLPPVRLPRFTYTSESVSLVPALKALGMVDAFDGRADFSGIDGTRGLFIGEVVHKAFIAVDEKGTEAAAATAVIMTRSSVGDRPEFIADRPFIFLIRDRRTGVVLFMGRIVDPAKES